MKLFDSIIKKRRRNDRYIYNNHVVSQITSYIPVGDELKRWLYIIQHKWGYEVIEVYETKVNKIPDMSDQGFIILYRYKEDKNESTI